jgi:hypothetical protein
MRECIGRLIVILNKFLKFFEKHPPTAGNRSTCFAPWNANLPKERQTATKLTGHASVMKRDSVSSRILFYLNPNDGRDEDLRKGKYGPQHSTRPYS